MKGSDGETSIQGQICRHGPTFRLRTQGLHQYLQGPNANHHVAVQHLVYWRTEQRLDCGNEAFEMGMEENVDYLLSCKGLPIG